MPKYPNREVCMARITEGSTRLEFEIARTERTREKAREAYVAAVEWLARDLTEAARRARDVGGFPSETVMSSSLVDNIPRHAIEWRLLGEKLATLRGLTMEE